MRRFAIYVAFLLSFSALGGAAQAQTAPPDDGMQAVNTAMLGWLDKLTGRVSTIEATVNETVKFGTLEIIVRACKRNPPEERPESAAFLDVWEIKDGQAADEVFRGWMFASSPALSAMEHPVYDVWVLECVEKAPTMSTPEQ